MKKLTALAAVLVSLAAPAFAGEVQSQCETYIAENGGDASGCPCLGAAAPDGSALAAEILKIDSPEALEAAGPGAKEAIAACFPDADV